MASADSDEAPGPGNRKPTLPCPGFVGRARSSGAEHGANEAAAEALRAERTGAAQHVYDSSCSANAVQEHREAACLAEEHAAAFEEKHQKLEEEYRRLQVECRQLRSRRSMRTSSPGHEVREEEEKEDLARQRWRRAGTEVVKRLSAGSLSFEEPSPSPKPPSPTSVTSPSRRSERNEELEQQLSNLAMERDAARAEKAASESHAQQLEDEAWHSNQSSAILEFLVADPSPRPPHCGFCWRRKPSGPRLWCSRLTTSRTS